MKLVRYTHPRTSVNEWDSLLGDPLRFFAPFFFSPIGSSRNGVARRAPASGVEWFESDHAFHARVDVPGMKREQLRLDAEEGVIRLTLESTEPGEGEAVRTSRAEYVLRCPEGIRTAGIEARLSDGILHLTLPKEEARKPLSIEIR